MFARVRAVAPQTPPSKGSSKGVNPGTLHVSIGLIMPIRPNGITQESRQIRQAIKARKLRRFTRTVRVNVAGPSVPLAPQLARDIWPNISDDSTSLRGGSTSSAASVRSIHTSVSLRSEIRTRQRQKESRNQNLIASSPPQRERAEIIDACGLREVVALPKDAKQLTRKEKGMHKAGEQRVHNKTSTVRSHTNDRRKERNQQEERRLSGSQTDEALNAPPNDFKVIAETATLGRLRLKSSSSISIISGSQQILIAVSRRPPASGGVTRDNLRDEVIVNHAPFPRGAPRDRPAVRNVLFRATNTARAQHPDVSSLREISSINVPHGHSSLHGPNLSERRERSTFPRAESLGAGQITNRSPPVGVAYLVGACPRTAAHLGMVEVRQIINGTTDRLQWTELKLTEAACVRHHFPGNTQRLFLGIVRGTRTHKPVNKVGLRNRMCTSRQRPCRSSIPRRTRTVRSRMRGVMPPRNVQASIPPSKILLQFELHNSSAVRALNNLPPFITRAESPSARGRDTAVVAA